MCYNVNALFVKYPVNISMLYNHLMCIEPLPHAGGYTVVLRLEAIKVHTCVKKIFSSSPISSRIKKDDEISPLSVMSSLLIPLFAS